MSQLCDDLEVVRSAMDREFYAGDDDFAALNRVRARIEELETALIQSCHAARLYGYSISAPMIDVMRVRRSIVQ